MNNIHLHIIGSESFLSLLKELDLNYIINLNSTNKNNYSSNHSGLLIRIVFVEKLKLTDVKKYFNENNPTIFLLNNKNLELEITYHLEKKSDIYKNLFKQLKELSPELYDLINNQFIIINNNFSILLRKDTKKSRYSKGSHEKFFKRKPLTRQFSRV